MEPDRKAGTPWVRRIFLESHLAYHLRCLREDASDPALTSLERLVLIRDRVARVRKIRRALAAATGDPCYDWEGMRARGLRIRGPIPRGVRGL